MVLAVVLPVGDAGCSSVLSTVLVAFFRCSQVVHVPLL